MSETHAGKGFWKQITKDLWWGSDHGSVYFMKGRWWGLNSGSKEVIDPFVGPFETAQEAMDAYDRALAERSSR